MSTRFSDKEKMQVPLLLLIGTLLHETATIGERLSSSN